MAQHLEELVSIPAGDATLEGRLAYPEAQRPTCAALLIGAHPLLGGNMSNNVVTALREKLAALGAVALSFEYRKLENPESQAWADLLTEFWQTHHVGHEPLWRDDARWAARFLRGIHPAPLVLVGYSFGCWAAAELAATIGPAAGVLISPNPIDHDLSVSAAVTAPLLVVASDNDFSCTLSQLHSWLDTLCGPPELRLISGAEHFFRGHEPELGDHVADFLRRLGLFEN